MKKLSLLFLVVLAFGAFFQSCNNSKTYAEQLADERKAIQKFKDEHNITTITKEEFEKDTITDVSRNEYVAFSNGVYLQIIDRGDGDTIKSRDEILIRMEEFNILSLRDNKIPGDTLSNVDVDWVVDSFFYTPSSSSNYFNNDGYFALVYRSSYSSITYLSVPPGLISVLPYLRNNARIKMIIPSKQSHNVGMSSVYPYYYDIRKIQIR